jgi:glycopeptide antibiotics resistance protein
MKTNKVLLGGIVGGIVFFLLGWGIYGMLMMDYFQANMDQSLNRPEGDFIWWAMIVSNLVTGLLYAMIFGWIGTSGFKGGAKLAAIIGFMFALSVNLSFYSMTVVYGSLTAVIVDVLIWTVISAIAGGIIGLVMGSGNKAM